jgi:hypothetical protein
MISLVLVFWLAANLAFLLLRVVAAITNDAEETS